MKLIIQIPCYNEEETIADTIVDIPRHIEGVDEVEVLVIDDGSEDRTIAIAKEAGVDHVIKNISNMGLAKAFLVGLDASLRLGADIIVNTDGDNQYQGSDIPKLIAPIMASEAEIVIGDRCPGRNPDFTAGKRMFQKIGSMVVRYLSKIDVPDAVSGFRAFSRNAAMELNIVSTYSYTIETIIQAGRKQIAVSSVPIKTNPKTRESRLFSSIPEFMANQLNTMVRMYTMYQPLKVFCIIGFIFLLGGMIPSVRFLYFYLHGPGDGHVQSLILAAILFVVGFQVLTLGLIGDVIASNRKLIEETLLRIKRIEFDHFNELK